MAYETGVTLGPVDLLGKIKAFAGLNGWTILHNAVHPTEPSNWQVAMKKNIDGTERFFYFQAKDDVKELGLRGLGGWDAGNADDASVQPGAAKMWTITNYLTAPMRRYWIFADTEYLHISVETTTGYFAHFGVGVLQKCQTYVGGEYVYGNYIYPVGAFPNSPISFRHSYPFDSRAVPTTSTPMYYSHVRAEGDGAPDGWYYFTSDTSAGLDYRFAKGQARDFSFANILRDRSGPIHYSGQGMLIPNYIYARYRDTGYWGYLGMTKDLRMIKTGGFDMGAEFTLGSDTWWAFPIRHDGGDGVNSGDYGIAFKVVP